MGHEAIAIVDFGRRYASELVQIWRLSTRDALGDYSERHSEEDFKAFLCDTLAKTHLIKVALRSSGDHFVDYVVGFVAFQVEGLNQLYSVVKKSVAT